MNEERVQNELILPNIKQDEEFIGWFRAGYLPSIWWFFLVGPLWGFGYRLYYVAVTDKGLHLHRLNILNKLTYTYHPFSELKSLQLGSGITQAPLRIVFADGKKLTLKAQIKGVGKLSKLDDKTRDFLRSRSK